MSELIRSDISANEDIKFTIMSRLRKETRREHQRIEKLQSMARIFSHDYTLTEYRHLLARLYGFYRAIEPMIFKDNTLYDRQKTVLLVRDLEALGLTNTEIRNLPAPTSLPSLNTFSRRMGALYVLEGSTLGAQVINRRLLNHFRDTVAGAIHFYSCYGDKVSIKWHEFREVMSRNFDDLPNAQEVIASARNTFSAFHMWLERPISHY